MSPQTNHTTTILVVEDGPGEREAMARLLRLEQFEVLTARDANHALTMIDRPIDLVLTDLRMGGKTGIDLLRTWHIHRPQTPFILVTAYGDVETAVEAMKLGARDFLTKPVDPKRLLDRIRAQVSASSTTTPSGNPPRPALTGVDRLLGESAAMKRIREQIRNVAQADSSVLVLGESGTGKELVAEAIHFHSARAHKPFVVINMAAVPEALVESELFGHARGAFTGATGDRVGRFEAADGGTLFIDEVGDFPPASQAKLLRTLETRVIQRLGSNEERNVQVRLVAATSRDLRRMVRDHAFREDLYYRLNVVTIELPPLRDRRDDLPQLIDFLVDQLSRTLGKAAPRLTAELRGFLIGYAWPGNVRQMRNVLESMLVLNRAEVLTVGDLPTELAQHAAGIEEGEDEQFRLDHLERSFILQTLKRCEGNRTRTAEALGISVRTLQRRLKEWERENESPT